VLFPEPGGPLHRHTCPATRPPPSTRSNSPRPVRSRRDGPRVATSETGRAGRVGGVARVPARVPARLPGARARTSSTRVEYSPHFGHRPYHFADSAAQAWQRYVVADLGTTGR
jgi:hypothetical protein